MMNQLVNSGDTVSDTLIEISNVSKIFGDDDDQIIALKDVSLKIKRGEFIALLGPSGCGKSTLLNLIAGFQQVTSGKILHSDKSITGPDARRTVVFQDYALFGWMNLQKNVEFGLEAKNIPPKQRTEIARDFLARVQLTGFENKFPHEVSGGMKQRAAIARAMAPDPEVLLMDEPLGALDAQTRVLLQEEISRLSSESGKTVIFVTHGIDEAVFLADRVVVMSPRPGRIRDIVTSRLPFPRTAEMRADQWFTSTVGDLWETLKPDWQKEDH